MTDSRDFFGALSRAYALGDEHPPHHPAVRVALAEAMTTLHASANAWADVSVDGLFVEGGPVGPPGDALGAALARAGVTRISVSEHAPTESLETLLRRIRVANGRPIRTGDLVEFENTGLRLSLAEASALDGPPVSGTGPDSIVGGGAPDDRGEASFITNRLARSISALFLDPDGRPNGGPGASGNGARNVEDGGSVDFEAKVSAYMNRPDPNLADQIVEDANTLDSEDGCHRVVEAIRSLAGPIDLVGKDPRLGLARRLGRPGVLKRLVESLSASPDPGDQTELKRIAVGVGASISDVLATAIAEARDRSVRRSLLETMVAVGAVAREPVRRMLDDERWFVVRNGVRLLPDVAGRGAVNDLVGVTTHPESRVRREAVTALARTGTPEAANELLRLVDDADPEVRAAAAAALGVIEVADRGAVLLRRLQLEVQPEVQVVLIRALAAAGHEAAVPELERRASRGLFTKRPRPLRLEAIHALWAIGTPRARAVVMATLDDRDPEIKGAVRALLGGH